MKGKKFFRRISETLVLSRQLPKCSNILSNKYHKSNSSIKKKSTSNFSNFRNTFSLAIWIVWKNEQKMWKNSKKYLPIYIPSCPYGIYRAYGFHFLLQIHRIRLFGWFVCTFLSGSVSWIQTLNSLVFSINWFLRPIFSFRFPFDWRTPIGYMFATSIQILFFFCVLEVFVTFLIVYVSVCQFAIAFVEDLEESFRKFENSVRNCGGQFSDSKQKALYLNLCRIVHFHVTVIQLSIKNSIWSGN